MQRVCFFQPPLVGPPAWRKTRSGRGLCGKALANRQPCASHKCDVGPSLESRLASTLRVQGEKPRSVGKNVECVAKPQDGKCDLLWALGLGSLMIASPAFASDLIREEPANALSLPTWVIHVSSVVEWVTAMALVWKFAEVSGKEEYKGLTWGMFPLLAGAITACTWHFFYNSTELEFLVAMQAFLTVLGNFTCWIATYRIFKASTAEEAA